MPHCKVVAVPSSGTRQEARACAFVMNPDHRLALGRSTTDTINPDLGNRYGGIANAAGRLTGFGRMVRDHCKYLMRVRGQK